MVNLNASSTDSMGAAASDSKTVTVSGSSKNKVPVTMMGNRIAFGSPLPGTAPQHGPTLFTDASPYELGVCFWAKCEGLKITGARIYKHPDLAGTIPVTLWDDTGAVMATTTVNWTADIGGWRQVNFPAASVTLSTTREYRLSYHCANGKFAGGPGVFEPQPYLEWPFLVKQCVQINGVLVGGSVTKAGAHGVPNDHFTMNYYVDVLGEVDMSTPAYSEGYMDQWINHTPAHDFPVGVFYADPEWIVDYASIGVNTMVAIPGGGEAYRNAILASGVDIWPDMPDIESLRILLSDPELAEHIKGWFITDEPDLAGTWKTPDEIRAVIDMIRSSDSSRPIMLNFGLALGLSQGWFFLRPGGKELIGHFDDLMLDIQMIDITSMDFYNATPNPENDHGWGPWTYYKQIKRMQQMSLNQKPLWGYVETASQEEGFPTPERVEQCIWSLLIAGAKGIVFFDHQFPTPAIPLDFAALLHKPALRAKVQSMASTMQQLAGWLKADEADLVVWFSSTNTTEPMKGGVRGVPIYYTSRIYNGEHMIIAQSARPGTTTATFQVPSAAGKTLTVRGESRTVTVDSGGMFSDDFTSDYQTHIYLFTPPVGRDTLVPGTYKPSASTTGTLPGITLTPYNTGGSTLTITMDNQVFQNLDIYGDINVQAAGVKFINCRLRGGTNWPTTNDAIADCRHPNTWADPPLFVDCTITADRPSYWRDGIMGNFTARRCEIYNINDGCGVYNTSTSLGAKTTIEACWIHDLVYWYPEPGTATDGTHNDCIQVQSGGDIHIIGNYLQGTASLGDDRAFPDPDGPDYSGGSLSLPSPDRPALFTQPGGPHTNGNTIIVQHNTGVALSNTVIVEKNWINKGGCGANLQDGNFIFRNNTFTRGGFYYYAGNPNNQFVIRPQDASVGGTITGLYTTNRYEDDGEVLTEANDGIRY